MLVRSNRFGQLIAIAGSLVISACQGQTASAPTAAPTLSPQQQANLTPEQAVYQKARAEFDGVIVPAAKKEGELSWYTCRQADEAEPMMKFFNQQYPDISVTYIYGPGNALVEKIVAEGAAGKVQADSYLCGGTSARNLAGRDMSEPFIPPSALDPSIEYHFPVILSSTKLTVWQVSPRGIGLNTSLIPEDKLPKTWWDALKDPYWVDLFKRNLVAIYDPRISGGDTHIISYGLRVLNPTDYGEEWVKLLASYKPRIVNVSTLDSVLRGEFYAVFGVGQTFKNNLNNDPLTTHCPQPGCTATQVIPVTIRGGPHVNAAKVWAEFWLTKPAQEFMAKNGEAVARKDVPSHPSMDLATHPLMFWYDDDHEMPVRENIKWITDSKLFDY
jgi:iron(III) transport system substrate-binding protein